MARGSGRIRIRRVAGGGKNDASGLCPVVWIKLETGEKLKRGCGNRGMVPCDIGWRCLYCGNLRYEPQVPVRSLWFHFKIAREYWRIMHCDSVSYVNGVPVHGEVDPIPRFLRADLEERHPPKWFPYFLIYDERQFKHYLEANRYGR